MAGFEFNSDYYGNEAGFVGELPSLSGIQYSVVTDLVAEPVNLSDFKQWARIDWNTDDALLSSILKEARQKLEDFTEKSFGAKTMKITALNLPKDYRLMYGPVASITTIGFEAVGDILKGGPYSDVAIEYTTAWPNLPETIKIAIFMHAAGKYINREDRYFSINGTLQEPSQWLSLAEKEVFRWANVIFP